MWSRKHLFLYCFFLISVFSPLRRPRLRRCFHQIVFHLFLSSTCQPEKPSGKGCAVDAAVCSCPASTSDPWGSLVGGLGGGRGVGTRLKTSHAARTYSQSGLPCGSCPARRRRASQDMAASSEATPAFEAASRRPCRFPKPAIEMPSVHYFP